MSPALERAVEGVGRTFEAAGMPRMVARVLAYALAEDRSTYTAKDLAEGLGVSPAAVSGAVRWLVNGHLLIKERAPSGRGDLYRILDEDIWSTIVGARLPMLDQFVAGIDEAIELLGGEGPGVSRLRETRDFFAFNRAESERMLERWQEARRTSP